MRCYTADLEDIAEKHGVSVHAYTQLYLHCRCADTAIAAGQLEQCITDVGRWMSANRLKLNKDKTELLWVGSRHSLSQQGCCLPVLQLGSDTITFLYSNAFMAKSGAQALMFKSVTDKQTNRQTKNSHPGGW